METPFGRDDLKVAVIGGGTGSFTLLSALKEYTERIASIVSMADDGGSTGVLRDELGALPPGDVRQCLVALSDSPLVRDLFDYRFEEGTFGGHSFGNIFLTALEKTTGSFLKAIDMASEILRINGTVIPATLDNVRLKMAWDDVSTVLQGERVIDAEYFQHDPRKAILSLTPKPAPNPTAIAAIEQADMVVIAPGDLYTSLGSLLVIDGVGEALRQTSAAVVYVCNLVTKQGQTDGFTVSDHAAEIERFAGPKTLDYVLYNEQEPDEETAKRYHDEGAYLVKVDADKLQRAHYRPMAGEFLGALATPVPGDGKTSVPVTRSLIRHDAYAAAAALMQLYEQHQNSLS